ncbi:MAG: winged helix-turn-helix transcriptional regulator [Hyphomicrobiaceae bacterium]|nr:winged helix-turn-helix transcriptional regulator [Hyphomicrobiaceae bacterium]
MQQDSDIRLVLKSIRKIARAVQLYSRRIDQDIGLTLPQYAVLDCVSAIGPVTGRAVAREVGLTPATVVGILDKLESKGLIDRHRSTKDRRNVLTSITSDGARALVAASPLLGHAFERAFLAMSQADRANILELLDRFADLALKDDANSGSDPDAPVGADDEDDDRHGDQHRLRAQSQQLSPRQSRAAGSRTKP